MKNTFLLDQYIALMECKLSIAKLHKEKRLAIRNNQSERPNLYLIIDESTTTYPTNDKTSHNPKPEPNLPEMNDQTEPTQTHNQTAQAFKEHFAHEFNELTELYEKLQAEGKYQEAKVVLEMSLVLGEWLAR